MKWFLSTVSILALTIVSGVPVALAQDCVRVDTDPPGSTLTLKRYEFSSAVAPKVFCTLERGQTYRLQVSSARHESRTLKFRLRDDGSANFSGMRLTNVARSIFPGWGQAAMKQPGRATMALTTALVSGARTFGAWRSWEDEKRTRDEFEQARALATTERDVRALDRRLEHASLNAGLYRDALLYNGAVAGWWYLGNLFESVYLASPPKTIRRDDGSFQLRIPSRSGTRAVVQSFLWPGMGQFYKGDFGRGFLFQGGVIAGALLTIDRKLLYDLRQIDYELVVRDRDNATSETERVRLDLVAQEMWSARETRRKQMYGWAGVTAGFWLLSVLDAALSDDGDAFPGRFEPETSFRSGTVFTGFRVAL